MNEIGSLLRRSLGFLWKHPVVLLPVLGARLLDFLLYLVCGLLKGPAIRAVAPHSVLGGLSGKLSTPTVLVAAFFTFFPLLCEVGLFVYAMLVCARWAHTIRETEHSAFGSWQAPAGEVARVAALTLAVGAATAIVGLYLTLHGGVPANWTYLVTWCFLIMASWFLLPSWLRMLARAEAVRYRNPSLLPPFLAMLISFVLYAACLFLGSDVQRNLEVTHRVHGAAVPVLVGLVTACLSILPLGFGFVAMSRYVAERPGWQSEAAEERG